MEANELRIGNLVLRTNKQTKEKIEITITCSCIMDIYSNGENSSFIYEPISLTEEWLLKFEFKHNSYPDSLTLNILSFGRLNAYSVSEDLTIELSTQSGYMFGTTGIKYVHQLQNVFFALTGIELN